MRYSDILVVSSKRLFPAQEQAVRRTAKCSYHEKSNLRSQTPRRSSSSPFQIPFIVHSSSTIPSFTRLTPVLILYNNKCIPYCFHLLAPVFFSLRIIPTSSPHHTPSSSPPCPQYRSTPPSTIALAVHARHEEMTC